MFNFSFLKYASLSIPVVGNSKKAIAIAIVIAIGIVIAIAIAIAIGNTFLIPWGRGLGLREGPCELTQPLKYPSLSIPGVGNRNRQ